MQNKTEEGKNKNNIMICVHRFTNDLWDMGLKGKIFSCVFFFTFSLILFALMCIPGIFIAAAIKCFKYVFNL